MSLYMPERLYKLLPAFLRVRDADQGEPLRALLAVIEGELERIEADTSVLYDNWFIETCDEWVVPYIGDLLGVRPIRPVESAAGKRTRVCREHDRVPAPQGHDGRARAAGARRDRLAGARGRVLHATGDDAAHEPCAAGADGDAVRARRVELPSSQTARSIRYSHTLEVRNVATRGGRYNIPNVGIFLWRLRRYAVGAREPRRRVARLRERTPARQLTGASIRSAATRRSSTCPAPRRRSRTWPEEQNVPGPAAATGAQCGARSTAPRQSRDARAGSFMTDRDPVLRMLRPAGRRDVAGRGAARRTSTSARSLRTCRWRPRRRSRSIRRAVALPSPRRSTWRRSGRRAAMASPATSAAARTTAVPRCARPTGQSRSTSRRPATSAASRHRCMAGRRIAPDARRRQRNDLCFAARCSGGVEPAAAWPHRRDRGDGQPVDVDAPGSPPQALEIEIDEGSKLLIVAGEWPLEPIPDAPPGSTQRVPGHFDAQQMSRRTSSATSSVRGSAAADSRECGPPASSTVCCIEGQLAVAPGNLGTLGLAHCTPDPGSRRTGPGTRRQRAAEPRDRSIRSAPRSAVPRSDPSARDQRQHRRRRQRLARPQRRCARRRRRTCLAQHVLRRRRRAEPATRRTASLPGWSRPCGARPAACASATCPRLGRTAPLPLPARSRDGNTH